MRGKYCEGISLLGTLLVQEYISTMHFVYMLCVYDTTDHILPVVCFYDFFFLCLTAVYIQYSSLLNLQLKDCPCSGSTTNHIHCILLPQFFGKGCLKDYVLHLKLLFKKTEKKKKEVIKKYLIIS